MKPINIIKELDSLKVKDAGIKEENSYGLTELTTLNNNCLDFVQQLVTELAKINLEKEPNNEEWKLISSINLKDEKDKISEFIKSIDEFNRNRVNDLDQIKTDNEDKSELYEETVKAKIELEEQNESLKANNLTLTTENAELRNKMDSLEKDFANLKNSYNTNFVEVNGIRKELQDKKEQQIKYWSENQNLSKQLKDKDAEIENFKAQLTSKVEEHSKALKDREELVRKYESLENEFNKLNSELTSIKNEQDSEESLDQRVKDLTDNNLEYASQIRIQEEKLRQAEEIDSSNKAKISELEKEIAKKMTELKDKSEQFKELSDKIERLEKELDALNKSISDINSKLDNNSKLSNDKQPEIKEDNTEIEEIKGAVQTLLGQIENLEKNNKRV